MSKTTGKILEFIPDMAQELPALVIGEPTTVDRLMLAASVCGWVMDYDLSTLDQLFKDDVMEENTAEELAESARFFLKLAIEKHQQENTQ